MSANKQIYITSINKAVSKAKVQGNLDISKANLFGLFKYYIEFTDDLKEKGVIIYDNLNKQLKLTASKLKYKYPDEICNYKNVIGNIGTTVYRDNVPPIVSNIIINLTTNMSYSFKVSDFDNVFSDFNNDGYSTIVIYPASLSGDLKYNGTPLTNTIEIPVSQTNNLVYERLNGGSFSNDTFTFKMSDNNANKLYSGQAAVLLSGDKITNEPPILGDNIIVVDNRITTVFTLAMFTTQLKPPYNDPEGDLIDAIRLDEINKANKGKFYLNGVESTEGQIITREDINAGLFTHVGPNQDDISSDNFRFSARDEGSKIWVE